MIPDDNTAANTPPGNTPPAQPNAEALADAEAQRQTDTQQQPDGPQVPQVNRPETMDDVRALAEALAEYRKEVAALRADLAKQQGPRPAAAAPTETPEERRNRKLELIAEHSHYCPGCGTLSKYPRLCEGGPNGPHPPIDMVSTEELGGDPANHTAAPEALAA